MTAPPNSRLAQLVALLDGSGTPSTFDRIAERLEQLLETLSSDEMVTLADHIRRLSNAIGDTVPVTVASLPLPAGAATDSTLATLKPPPLGQAQASASLPVVLANDQDSIADRIHRRVEEETLIELMDVGTLSVARRQGERTTLSDRRGRTTRGASSR